MQNLTIVGSGLLAKSFCSLSVDKELLLFASGVSNSAEVSSSAFGREERLLLESLEANTHAHFIYFSTCSIEGEIVTAYTRHKLHMENLVARGSGSYSIFRLPQVVGYVRNTTLISYLADAILTNKRISLQKFARRHLIDVDDVVRIATFLLRSELAINSVINISPRHDVSVVDVYREICFLLNSFPDFDFVDSGSAQVINIKFLEQMLSSDDLIFSADYWRSVLKKHVPKYLAG